MNEQALRQTVRFVLVVVTKTGGVREESILTYDKKQRKITILDHEVDKDMKGFSFALYKSLEFFCSSRGINYVKEERWRVHIEKRPEKSGIKTVQTLDIV